MELNNVTAQIVVAGREIDEYLHNGQTFIEGRKGSEYIIRITNRNSTRVSVAVSVDGLCVIDGKPASLTSTPFLVDAHSTINIQGWQRDTESAAAFKFGSRKGSYAAVSAGHDSRNIGVIGIAVHEELVNKSISFGAGYIHGAAPSICRSIPLDNVTLSAMGSPTTLNMGNPTTLNMVAQSSAAYSTNSVGSNLRSASVASAALNNVGTEWGQNVASEVTTEEFKRGDLLGVLAIYYDDRDGLKARGIDLSKPKFHTPNPFPATGFCQPPTGY